MFKYKHGFRGGSTGATVDTGYVYSQVYYIVAIVRTWSSVAEFEAFINSGNDAFGKTSRFSMDSNNSILITLSAYEVADMFIKLR